MSPLDRRGNIYRLQVYQAGRAVRESMGTSDKAETRRLLKEWEGQIAKDEVIPKFGKETWDEASTDLRGYYQAYGMRNPREAGHRIAYLGGLAVKQLLEADIADVNCEYTCVRPWLES
jgi:hypothetical protein